MPWILLFLLALWLPGAARADTSGWEYLMRRLVADGVDEERVRRAFADSRLPPFTEIEFSDNPRGESHHMYRGFLRADSVGDARRCRREHAPSFERAGRRFGVSPDVVAAILHVETRCGRNTGSSPIFYRLARLAMANEPVNVDRNFARLAAEQRRYDPELETRVRQRGRYLEATFYPEVRALFEVATRLGTGPLDLRGSAAGAFGYPQFLPSSYLKHGADGDGDGEVSLYDIDDAAASCARYLANFGWREGIPRPEQREVIWHYNRSEAYIDAVLGVAERIVRDEPAPTRAPRGRAVKSGRSQRLGG